MKIRGSVVGTNMKPEKIVDRLPIATPETLGGVMPLSKTDDMSQPVCVDKYGRLYTHPCKVNPMPKTEDMTQAVGVDEVGSLWTTPSEGGGGEPYVLPVATSSTLGGVKPTPKTAVMGQPVGVDSGGLLWTEGSKVNPMPIRDGMTQAVGMDESGGLWTYPSADVGDIETALDSIIAIQNELIGGDAE